MSTARPVGAAALVWAVATGIVACGSPPPPPPMAPVVDIRRLMSGLIDPSADIVWQSVSITIDRDGEHHKRPTTNEDWLTVQNHAMIVAEAANLLMIAPRAKDDGEWMQLSKRLRDVSSNAYEIALKQDADALLMVGGEIYDACAACHRKYLPPGEEDPI
jgi:hypothetical protein